MTNARSRFIQSPKPTDPCPCGSGRAYSACHRPKEAGIHFKAVPASEVPASVAHQFELAEAKEQLRKMQQGLGKPIMSAKLKDYRFVAIGNEVVYSKKFGTFHDFLFWYVRQKLGTDWGGKELEKAPQERHPVLHWYDKLCDMQRQHQQGEGEIASAPLTGATAALLRLAYSLYLLQHNVALQESLLQRLRHRDQFYPAFYETLVAGAFIRAGFEVKLEREEDSTRSHCEFTATSKKTGNRYSVEAKLRQPGKDNNNVRNQLHAALEKRADHERIVFIELNLPGHGGSDIMHRMEEAIQSVIRAQDTMTVDRQPAPPAYVTVSNHPWVHDLDGVAGGCVFAAHGFKISGFEFSPPPQTVESAVHDREKHQDIFDLISTLRHDGGVPSTFDGDMPELAFAKERVVPLVIGERYDDLDGGNGPISGLLEEATVLPPERAAYCIFRTDDGRRIIVKAPLTGEEMLAYERFPDVFFGRHKPQLRSDDPVDFFQWLLSTYAQTPKEGLLEIMKGWPGQEQLAALSQPELARKYCLHLTEEMVRRSQRVKATKKALPKGG